MANLTTMPRLKTYLGISEDDITYDDLLDYLLNSASDEIERYCRRHFIIAEYRHHIDGNGEKSMFLWEFPVTRMYSVRMGGVNCFFIQYTSTTANQASVEIDDTVGSEKMTLLSRTSGVWTETEITLASYPTITLLLAYINTLSGWSATAITTEQESLDSDELLPFQGGDCLNTQHTITTTDDVLDSWKMDKNTGELSKMGVWSYGIQNVHVRYKAGFAASASLLPDSLQQLTCEYVKILYDAKNTDQWMESERLGDYQYKRAVQDAMTENPLPGYITHRLNYWTRPSI